VQVDDLACERKGTDHEGFWRLCHGVGAPQRSCLSERVI
jgi:hypothetical protein